MDPLVHFFVSSAKALAVLVHRTYFSGKLMEGFASCKYDGRLDQCRERRRHLYRYRAHCRRSGCNHARAATWWGELKRERVPIRLTASGAEESRRVPARKTRLIRLSWCLRRWHACMGTIAAFAEAHGRGEGSDVRERRLCRQHPLVMMTRERTMFHERARIDRR